MPNYQMLFETVNGEVRDTVQIDDDEVLEGVLDDILYELKERRNVYLKGPGDPQVRCNGTLLDPNVSLRQQGVHPNDLLRVSTRAIIG